MICVDDLCKQYSFFVNSGILFRAKKTIQVLKHISFEVKPGEILGLVGSNGAGKTTIVKIVAGVLRPDSGTVLVDGDNPFKRTKSFRKKVSMVFGNRGKIHQDMSIFETSALYGSMYGLTRDESVQRARYIGNLMSLQDEDMNKQARTLSLGQKMKGEICVALVNEPHIIFLDEPTLGLDITSTRAIRRFLNEYCHNTKASCILTSHNLGDIREVSSKLLVINKGDAIFYGPVSDLPNQFDRNCTIQFKADVLDKNILSEIGSVSQKDDFFYVSCQPDEIDIVLNRLYQLGTITSMKVHTDDFEEIVERILSGE